MRGTDRGKGWAFLSGSRGEAKWIVLLFFVVLFFHGSYRIFNLNLRISLGCRFFFLSAFQMKAFFFDRMLRLAARKIFLKIKTLYIHTQIQLAFLVLHI